MNHASITHDLLLNTGRFVGRLGNALAGFDHPGLHRVHMWDLACTPEVERFVPMINDSEVSTAGAGWLVEIIWPNSTAKRR
jgi:Ser/Thr protein kinase RdoA (MazF antagonist)